MSSTQLRGKATASETVELATALLSFVLAMMGVNERVKAGADLLKAIAKVCSAHVDLPPPASDRTPPHDVAGTTAATSEPVLFELNLRKVLDALAILTIEVTTPGFLAMLEGRKIADETTAICRADSPYAADPSAWTTVGWVRTVLAGSSLAENTQGMPTALRLDMPNVTTAYSGELGAVLQTGAPVSSSRELHVNESPTAPVVIVGSKRTGKRELRVSLRSVWDLRLDLKTRGIRLKGRKPLQGYVILLSDNADSLELFSVVIISSPKARNAA